MNKAFMDICQVGNFSVNGVKPSEIKRLSKVDGKLYGIVNGKRYELIAFDESSEMVIRNFSDFPDESNESIYECREFEGHLVVMLYVFATVRRIDLESETMYFYMDRMLKSDLEAKGIITGGDEVKFLQNEFMINKSILVVEYPGERAIKTFQIYGDRYSANVERERPGVYRIKTARLYKVNNRVDYMTQFYGNINFVTFDVALQTKGNDIPATQVKTNEIFKTWEEFLGFESEIFNEEVRAKGFAKYSAYEYCGGELIIRFEKNINESSLFEDRIQALNQEYDIVFSDVNAEIKNVEDLIKIRDSSKNVIRLGRTLNEAFETNEIRFNIPFMDFDIPERGYLLLSDRNIKSERKRRDAVMRTIEAKTNLTSNMLMRLSAGEEDSQTGTDIEPITSEVKRKMFGREDVNIKENFRKAMYIALNTPDVALIQGPPGTGKTTLINGIIARLSSMGNKNYKILISSEQHEALGNVVKKLAGKSIPPFITSQKYSQEAREENEAKMLSIVEGYQKNFLELCDNILNKQSNESGYSNKLTKIIFDIQSIIDSRYSKQLMIDKLKSITELVIKIGLWTEVKDIIETIESKISLYDKTIEDEREGMDFIKRKLQAQRIDRQAFEDDGLYQLKELQRIITRFGYNYLLAKEDLVYRLENDMSQETFEEFLQYIQNIKADISPETDEFELAITSYEDLFNELLNKVRSSAKNRRETLYDVVEALKYKMSDINNVKDVIRKYTNVVGSTCAQAHRSMEVVDLQSNKYDYVIIDEAARANPLDLMIPVLLGIKVIMVGDQMQLPHYVETEYIRRFKEERDKYKAFDETLLTKSLFQVMYDSLEKSWNEGKLKFQRHIRIQEQHRMHPVIGDFISKQFYEKSLNVNGVDTVVGKIENGEGTIKNINDYGVYNGKNMAWINVPITLGMEEKSSGVISRSIEVETVIKSLKDIIRKNQGKTIKIGIISFYKGQVELINRRLKDEFPDEIRKNVECNTVDSYQGREFDVVFLSTTRSNVEPDIGKALGFIHYSNSRINVALSRARKLLVVVGDCETMGRNEKFESFINYTKKVGYYGE